MGCDNMRRVFLTVTILLVVVCVTATELAPGDKAIQRILKDKNAAVMAADRQYSKIVDQADQGYAKAVNLAETARQKAVDEARRAAVRRLLAFAGEQTQGGNLASAIKAYKAAYSIEPQNKELIRVLTEAKVDLSEIPIDPEGAILSPAETLADRIVIWNTHNARHNTSGARECNVVLLHEQKEVWRSHKIKVPWRRGEDTFATVKLPSKPFTK
ncbi:MAG: hypothetical protein J7M14_00965, partial [Planctomycetes bacterium]|nr:hypothetical protein [Planctomycetota bacterium]